MALALGRRGAASDYERGRAVGGPGNDAKRIDDLDRKSTQDHSNGERAGAEHLLRLADPMIEPEDLVESAQGQKQKHELVADHKRDKPAVVIAGP
jgi:hypothetical protein